MSAAELGAANGHREEPRSRPQRFSSSTTTPASASRSPPSSAARVPDVEAESGEAALREVMKRGFAVILMDVRMPLHGRLRDLAG